MGFLGATTGIPPSAAGRQRLLPYYLDDKLKFMDMWVAGRGLL